MLRYAILSLAFVISLLAAGARTISGTVLSSVDSTAVAGAVCRAFSGENAVVATTADAEGVFALETDVRAGLRLEISMTGFTPTEVLIEPGTKGRDFGVI